MAVLQQWREKDGPTGSFFAGLGLKLVNLPCEIELMLRDECVAISVAPVLPALRTGAI
ncbi:MAG: hypothetical protein GY791_19615 [Alphaproteobacteria bacterium]|nr:hypothetical protein [Alphaproteobacteria bacterium]